MHERWIRSDRALRTLTSPAAGDWITVGVDDEARFRPG